MYHCTNCDAQSLKWAGRCAECGKWGTLTQEGEAQGAARSKQTAAAQPAAVVSFNEVAKGAIKHKPTGISELDRVLGGGIVPGQVILLTGEPGVGKSTLLANLAASIPEMMYVAGEESPSQLKMRFERVGSDTDKVQVIRSTEVEPLVAAINKHLPPLVVVDSIQSMLTREHDGAAGAPTHLRAATAQLVAIAKETDTPIVLVGQITKDGNVAGPKMLEHMVDTVLHFGGDPRHAYRLLRATKHRFGSTDEVGVFEMTEKGLMGVESPSDLFVNKDSNAAGTALTCTIEGSRAFLIEIQALVNTSSYGTPVRRGSGFKTNRLQMLLAILEKHGKMSFSGMDVYVNVVGGMQASEPAVDLAVCAALVSSKLDKPLPQNTVVFGEVGLGGEVRQVPMSDRRSKEASRLGIGNTISNKQVGRIAGLVAKLK